MMVPVPSVADFAWTADLEAGVEDALRRVTRHLNGHTATGVWPLNGRMLHIKVSELSLATEAGLLMAELSRPQGRDYHTIRLVAFNARRNVIVTEFVDGQSLFNIAWNAFPLRLLVPAAAKRAALAYEAAACWLKGYHDAYALDTTEIEHREHARNALLGRVLNTLDSFPDAPGCPWTDKELDALRTHARALASSDHWAHVDVARIHGDFTAHANIIVDRRGVVSIADFGDSRAGFRMEDVVRLWTALWEIGEARALAGTLVRSVLPRVLERTDISESAMMDPPFQLFRVLFALRRVREAQLGLPGAPLSTGRRLTRLAAPQAAWLRRTMTER